jgi:bifunctional UDP-N-acetylglucosamine pyrophosphorylase/glucosamine-1-phosphate N-acetyltransferase
MRNRILSYHMRNGVMIEDPSSTFIGSGVSIGKGVRISPNNIISGNTVIKDDVRIDAGNNIDSCILESGVYMLSSRAIHSFIGKNTEVGPYAHIREDNVIGENCKIGDFVELKKCHIGNNCKMSHLSYLGDVIMGHYCNVGAGVVFANYDGKNKHTTMVGHGVFIGSKATIVAPVTLSDGAFIAAGSTITQDVSTKALAIARARQVEKPDWKGNLYLTNRHE